MTTHVVHAVIAGCLCTLSLGTAAAGLELTLRNAYDQTPLAGVLVLANWPGAPQRQPLAEPASMRQRDKAFLPGVLVIPPGGQVDFPNEDSVRHHVYSFSPARTFDLKLYAGKPEQPVDFPVPGIVALGCNIHDQMRAHIVVSDQPQHAFSDAAGHVRLLELPASGTLTLTLWHPDLPKDAPLPTHNLVLPATEPVNLELPIAPPQTDSGSLRRFKRYTD